MRRTYPLFSLFALLASTLILLPLAVSSSAKDKDEPILLASRDHDHDHGGGHHGGGTFVPPQSHIDYVPVKRTRMEEVWQEYYVEDTDTAIFKVSPRKTALEPIIEITPDNFVFNPDSGVWSEGISLTGQIRQVVEYDRDMGVDPNNKFDPISIQTQILSSDKKRSSSLMSQALDPAMAVVEKWADPANASRMIETRTFFLNRMAPIFIPYSSLRNVLFVGPRGTLMRMLTVRVCLVDGFGNPIIGPGGPICFNRTITIGSFILPTWLPPANPFPVFNPAVLIPNMIFPTPWLGGRGGGFGGIRGGGFGGGGFGGGTFAGGPSRGPIQAPNIIPPSAFPAPGTSVGGPIPGAGFGPGPGGPGGPGAGGPPPGQPVSGPQPGQAVGGPQPGQPVGGPQPGQPVGGPQPGQPVGGPQPGQPIGGPPGQTQPGAQVVSATAEIPRVTGGIKAVESATLEIEVPSKKQVVFWFSLPEKEGNFHEVTLRMTNYSVGIGLANLSVISKNEAPVFKKAKKQIGELPNVSETLESGKPVEIKTFDLADRVSAIAPADRIYVLVFVAPTVDNNLIEIEGLPAWALGQVFEESASPTKFKTTFRVSSR